MKRFQGLILMAAAGLVLRTSLAAADARLMRQPAVSAAEIAFVYAGDVWIVPKAGGLAVRLTTSPGEESFPRFSPDGRLLAYTASYDGNEDIYVVPAAGGIPKRLTHHPAPDRTLGWSPDGAAVLFASTMASGIPRVNQLFRVPRQGGLPEKLPVPYGEFGALSPDGRILAYVPNSMDLRTWKRYRGGCVSRIWLFEPGTRASIAVGDEGASSSQPMWHGSTLYFLSDRGSRGRANLWARDGGSGRLRQVTDYEDFDVRFPSVGPSEIVFEIGGRLELLDLATEKVRGVKVDVRTDGATLKPRWKKVSDLIARGAISPSGQEVVFEARGDLFRLSAEPGPVQDMTRTSGAAERFPAWSPDGKTIAYWSDRTGEYELTVRRADGTGGERTVTRLGPGFRYRIFWSPDSTRVAFADQAMNIELCDIASGAVIRMDKALYLSESPLERFTMSWSPDARWVAFSRPLPNRKSAVFLYDTREKRLAQATSGFCDDFSPVFDPEGQYLFYGSSRGFRPAYGTDDSWIFANTDRLVAVPLRLGVRSPLALAAGETADGESPSPVRPGPAGIDLEGFEGRAVILPPREGRYAGLQAFPGRLFFRRLPRTGSGEEKTALAFYDIAERAERTVLDDADSYEIAAGGGKILAGKKSVFAVIDAKPGQKLDRALPTSEIEMLVDPIAEWRQIFADVWRFERDFFYDPNMHGVDWAAMRERYGALLEGCVTRYDVNDVLGEMLGELNSSHAFRSGGDLEAGERRGIGLLGADYALENGAFRIKRICRVAPWDADVRSPLLEPGLGISEGDYLLAVNDARLETAEDPWAAFDGLAGKPVRLRLNSRPSFEGARVVTVMTLGSEERLRQLDWVETNRLKVEKAGGGRVGYIYVPDTGALGKQDLYREFMGQLGKEGLVIDERFNGGGDIPDRFIDLLARPVANYWAVRDGQDWRWPWASAPGPKVMLINGWSSSGGDAFPHYFRQAGLGPLVGLRTHGALIGTLGAPPLVDGGRVTVPTIAVYSTDGRWIIEGRGVDPDIRVVDDPAKMVEGGDPQLERGLEEVLRLLKEKPPAAPARPAYTDRSGR